MPTQTLGVIEAPPRKSQKITAKSGEPELEPDQRTAFSRESREVLDRIEAEVSHGIQRCDPDQQISNEVYADIIAEIVDTVFSVMEEEGRTELNDRDLGFIKERARRLTRESLPKVSRPARRFGKLDRVVCYIGGDRQWAPGRIQSLDEDDPQDPTGQTILPYVVKLDPPVGRMISVPKDSNEVCRAEVCFGSRAGANLFTSMCMPQRRVSSTRRFAEGDRVACAVEDATDDFTEWAAGTVVTVEHTSQGEGNMAPGSATVPYKVDLDNGNAVLVHRDEHIFIRELALQPAGPCIGAGGTRCTARFAKRKKAAGEGFEMVDHQTRQVRAVQDDGDDD